LKNSGNHTYGQILKSSALIGGSSVMRIGLGIARTKAMAVLLEPAGIGLMGLFTTIAEMAQTLSGVGINTSGVRQIAEAAGTDDAHRIARTVTTLRRVALVLGLLGAVLLVVLCRPVARLSFGSYENAGAVALLSLAVFFGAVSAGQSALVQGMRRIRDLAMINVLGGLYGTLLSIGIVYFFWRAGDAKRGVVPALVCVAAMGIVTSWYYSRKIRVERVKMNVSDLSEEVSELLKLGFVFMAICLMFSGVGYLTRMMILRRLGEDAAGFYQAAWAMGGLYVGMILQAMGADFYPRLTAVAKDNAECNRLANEQAEVSLLLAGPGVMGTLTFAPLVIQLFYSSKFGPAVEVLRWICLGMLLRVVTWPIGFIVVAKGARWPFFWSELGGSALQVALAWVFMVRFGLKGTGIAFFTAYVFYLGIVFLVVRSLSGFQWSAASRKLGMTYGLLVAALFVAWYFLPHLAVEIGGGVLTALAGIYSARTLCGLIPTEKIPPLGRRALAFFRLMPSGAGCGQPRPAALPGPS
jgi:enterobacterial common antigen flippase